MSAPLTFESILAAMNDETPSTKTASVVDTSEQAMLDTVRTLTQSQKTASASSVSADAVETLSKIAAHTAAAEGMALEKQAQILGAALCDGFMVRLAGYDSAVAEKRATFGETVGRAGMKVVDTVGRGQDAIGRAGLFDTGLRGAATGALTGGGLGAGLGAMEASNGDGDVLDGALRGGMGGAVLGAGAGGAAGHYGAKELAQIAQREAAAAKFVEGLPLRDQVNSLQSLQGLADPASESARELAARLGTSGAMLGATVAGPVGGYLADKEAAYTLAQLKLAYAQGADDFQKQAQVEYAQGQEDALQAIHKLASEIHLGGQQSAANVLASLR